MNRHGLQGRQFKRLPALPAFKFGKTVHARPKPVQQRLAIFLHARGNGGSMAMLVVIDEAMPTDMKTAAHWFNQHIPSFRGAIVSRHTDSTAIQP